MRFVTIVAVLLALCFPAAMGMDTATATAQSKRRGKTSSSAAQKNTSAKSSKEKEKEQRFVFSGIDLEGQLRTPQLLYFLDRANEELKRASLERRSFIPEMVRSIDEEGL